MTQNAEAKKLNGLGRLTLKSGAVYEGHFLDGCMHGQGKLVFPDGIEYEGQFQDGAMEGSGVRGFRQPDTYVQYTALASLYIVANLLFNIMSCLGVPMGRIDVSGKHQEWTQAWLGPDEIYQLRDCL